MLYGGCNRQANLLFVFLLAMPASVCHPSHVLPLPFPMKTFILGYTQGIKGVHELRKHVSAGPE